jgi:putative endonuclease
MYPKQLAIGVLERGIAFFDRLVQKRGKDEMPVHLRVGLAGEDAAFFHLLRNGYTVVARRWSAGTIAGDVDLIAWKDGLLCIIEVKTRSAHTIAPAEAAVDEHKRQTLRKLTRAYTRQLSRADLPQVRFDVISVYLEQGRKPEIVHFENAFGWTRRYED